MTSSNLKSVVKQSIHRSFQLIDSSPDERFDRLSALTKSIFNVAVAAVTFVDEETSTFKSAQGTALESLPNNESLCAHAIATGRDSFVISNLIKEQKFKDSFLARSPNNIRFYAGVPFQDIYGNKLGTLCILDTKPRDLSSHELTNLKNLSYLVGEILKATQTAMNDPLTALLNRRGFASLAIRTLDLSTRTKSPFTLVVIDLNAFKLINDNYGHKTGDSVLQYFANQLKEATRTSDIVGRLGGDEFAILLPDTDNQNVQFLSRLNNNMSKGITINNVHFHIKYSAGSVLVTDFKTRYKLEDLLVSADKAMYLEKKSYHLT